MFSVTEMNSVLVKTIGILLGAAALFTIFQLALNRNDLDIPIIRKYTQMVATAPILNNKENNVQPQGQLANIPVFVKSDVDLVKYFDFLPNNVQECTTLFNDVNKKQPYPEEVQAALDTHAETIKKLNIKLTEGHSIKYIEEALMYIKLVQLPFVETVCETGFNAGHSTLVWLSANPKVNVYSFDLGAHGYSKPLSKEIQKIYPNRLTMTWGDSSKTMPKFIANNPNVRCDLMIIDGGHTTDVCLADFKNFKTLANPVNMVLIDNYPDNRFGFMKTIGNCWESRKKNAEIAEVMRCGFGHTKGKKGNGFSFGRILK